MGKEDILNLPMKVNSIFDSIEGEGIEVGAFTKFIRFQGCSISCKWCDTRESWNRDLGTTWTIGDIVQNIENSKIIRVSLTGGNPCEQENIQEFVDMINLNTNCRLHLEHPGIFLNFEKEKKLISSVNTVGFDLKGPSANIKSSLTERYFNLVSTLNYGTYYKCVVSTLKDLEYYKTVIPELLRVSKGIDPIFYLTPCDSKKSEVKVEQIIEAVRYLPNSRLGYQMHKFYNLK